MGSEVPMRVSVRRDLSPSQARLITDRIRSSMGNLMILVSRAWHGRVWIALDYESWADYIAEEFGHAPLSLPQEERKAVSELLKNQGMSTRAIAPALGVSEGTVRNDLNSGAQNYAPEESVPITGLDGKTYTRPEPRQPTREVEPPPPPSVTCPTCRGTGKVMQ